MSYTTYTQQDTAPTAPSTGKFSFHFQSDGAHYVDSNGVDYSIATDAEVGEFVSGKSNLTDIGRITRVSAVAA